MKSEQLIIECLKGDSAAQRRLFDNYYKYVYTICHRYLRHHQDAEDVVSIVFQRVFDNLYKVKRTEADGLQKWIHTISINESLRFLQRKSPIDYRSDIALLIDDYPVEAPESSALYSENILKRAINELPTGYRTIFLLNVVEGLSHSEIAKHLNISRNTSKSQMLKARNYLKTKFKRYEAG